MRRRQGKINLKEGDGNMDEWKALRRECLQCKGCGLAETRIHVVFGDGNEAAEVMFVGEGPGQNEDEQGVPFVGKGGQLLDDMLEMIGLDRTMAYICNMVKCRPPQNRDPLNVEMAACRGWLDRQIALARPKILVCLGRIAAKELIKQDFKITVDHGQWFTQNGVEMTAIYHPAALLRDPLKRPETFEDLKGIQQKIRALCPNTKLNV